MNGFWRLFLTNKKKFANFFFGFSFNLHHRSEVNFCSKIKHFGISDYNMTQVSPLKRFRNFYLKHFLISISRLFLSHQNSIIFQLFSTIWSVNGEWYTYEKVNGRTHLSNDTSFEHTLIWHFSVLIFKRLLLLLFSMVRVTAAERFEWCDWTVHLTLRMSH